MRVKSAAGSYEKCAVWLEEDVNEFKIMNKMGLRASVIVTG